MENVKIEFIEDPKKNIELIKNKLADDGIAFFYKKIELHEFKAFGEQLGNIYSHKDAESNGITIVKTKFDSHKIKDGKKGLTSSNLFPHTDRSTMINPPNILMFYCNLQSKKEEGGESILIDMKNVLESIINDGKEDFLKVLFKENSIIFDDHNTSFKGNIIERLHDNSFFLRFRNDNFSFFTPEFYSFLNYFYSKMEDNKIHFKLEEGQGYIINNGRFLHGRNEFKGDREMWRLLIHDKFLKHKGFQSKKLESKFKEYSEKKVADLLPSDCFSNKYPVSIKGIIEISGKIVLLKNERDEWELPGGKIDKDESCIECLTREIKEELNIDVSILKIIDTWVYDIIGKIDVIIVTYLCSITNEVDIDKVKISNEHKEIGYFDLEEIKKIKMPEGYKNSINTAFKKV